MSSNIIAALILAVAILILAGVLLLMYRQRQKVRAKVESERREREEKEAERKLHAKQREAGNILFAELVQAAVQNKVSNLLDDGIFSKTVGPIEVERLEHNGELGYSIIVNMPDPTCATYGGLKKTGYTIFQVSINLKKTGKEIHVFKGPYGPERDYSRAEFDDLRSKLYEYVEKFRFYSDPQPDDSIFQPQ
jgi:hypothetical protein